MRKRSFILTAVFSLLFASLTLCFPLEVQAEGVLETLKNIYSSDVNHVEKNMKKKIKADVDAEIEGAVSGGSHTNDVFSSLAETLLIFTAGPPDSALEGLTEEEKEAVSEIYGPSAIDSVTSYVAALYQPPASSTVYVADLFESARIIPKAQAQGTGFAALNPILDTWKTFRDLAYMFFVVIFLVLGFMIMFRHKLDGQTVVTAQQAIPNIVVSLIFVTFSYAIAGLLIDLMYVAMYLIVGLFNGSREMLNLNIFQLGFRLITHGFSESFTTVNQSIQRIVSVGGLKQVVGWASSLTVSLIVAIAILFSVFKLFLELLKSYVMIILNVAFGPLFLMMGAIPGNDTFSGWIKQIIGNLAAFPAVLLLMLISSMISSYNIQTGGFMPPFMLGQGLGGVMPSIIGIGILIITPETIEQIKKALGVEEGVLTQLASSAWNQVQAGEVAIPATMGMAQGTLGGINSLGRSLKSGKRRPKQLWNNFMQGFEERPGDEDGIPQVHGGFARRGGAAWDKGQNIRKWIDRLQEGRAFEAEDIESTLTRLAQKSEKPETEPSVDEPKQKT